jgi:hypothetical protein
VTVYFPAIYCGVWHRQATVLQVVKFSFFVREDFHGDLQSTRLQKVATRNGGPHVSPFQGERRVGATLPGAALDGLAVSLTPGFDIAHRWRADRRTGAINVA